MNKINKTKDEEIATSTSEPLRRIPKAGASRAPDGWPSPSQNASAGNPDTESNPSQGLCHCHQFLQTGLADTKKARSLPDDMGIALLLEILWVTRTRPATDDGAIGISLNWDCSEWSCFGNSEEIHATLQVLAQTGIIRLRHCIREVAADDEECRILVIELAWLDRDEDQSAGDQLAFQENPVCAGGKWKK